MALIAPRLVCLALVLCVVVASAEAARIETFNVPSCDGSPTNTFLLDGGCQRFNDQGAVRISEIGDNIRVSIHNQQSCEGKSSVAQIYGPGCVVQGRTALRAVYVAA